MIVELEARFEVRRLLGEGGMGQVYLAQDRISGREVAVKVMLPDLCDSQEAVSRFTDEFQAMRRLRHPRILGALDFVRPADAAPFFTMEVLSGPGLDALIPAEGAVARGWLVDALEALAFLHAQGVLHNDLKPDNLRLAADGRLTLMDFGLIGPVGEASKIVRGTPLYVSPEAARGEPLDGRSDLYSLGAVFYHVLTGRPPFESERALDLMEAHQRKQPVPVTQLCRGLPDDLADVVMALLEKSPLDRPQTARHALERLGVTAFSVLEPGLVGREPDLASLTVLLDAERREPEAVTIVAPLGTGKTRLLEAFTTYAQTTGWEVLGAWENGASAEPYGTLSAIRRGLEVLAGQRQPAQLGDLLRDLEGGYSGLEPRAAQLRTHAAWERLIGVAAGTRRLVLVLDDWESADEATRDLLEALIRRQQAPFLLLAASQGPAIGTPLTLANLSKDATGEFVARTLGERDAFPAFVEGLYRMTGGAPLLLAGAMAELLRLGKIPREGGEWQTDRVELEALALPSDARALAQQRLDGLGASAQRLAMALAVSRRVVPLADLAAWIDLEEPDDATSQLAARELIASSGEGLRLAQPMLASLLLEGADPRDLAGLHAAIARGLEREGPSSPEVDLAYHWHGAGEGSRAMPYALAGARRMVERYCLGEAERLIRLALDLPELQGANRASALETAGDIARYRADFERAQEAYEEAIALRGELGGAVSRLKVNLTLVLHMQSQFEKALAMAQAAAEAAETEGNPAEEARAWTTLGRLRHFTGDPQGAQQACEKGLARARLAGDRELEAEALGMLGYLHVGDPERMEEALAHLQDSLRIREELADSLGLNDAYMLMGNAQMALGRYPEAMTSFERNLSLCREVGAARDDEATARINLSQVSAELGRFTEALTQAGAAVELAKASGNRFLEGYALALRGRIRARLGQQALAEEDVSGALAIAEALTNPYLEIAALTSRTLAARLSGNLDEALASALRGLDLTRETGIPEYEIDLILSEGEVLGARGEHANARASFVRACELASSRRAAGKLGVATLAQARVALTSRELAEATRLLGEAMVLAEGAGMRPLKAEAELLTGQLALAEGRLPEAVKVLRAVQTEFKELGLGTLVAEAEAALAAAQKPTAVPGSGIGDVIADFGRMVTGTLRYEEVLDRVIDQVMEITGADRGMIMLVDGSGALSGLVTRPVNDVTSPHLMAFSQTFAQAALRERRSIWVADAQSDERFSNAKSVMALDLRTVICVPLIVDEAPIGLLYLDQQSINRTFREEDLRLVEGLGGFAALAIANARRFEEAQERSAILSAVQEIAQLVTGSVAREEVLRTILKQALRVARADSGVLFWRDPLRAAYSLNRHGEANDVTWDAELVGKVDRTGQPISSLDVPDPAGPQTVMALPLNATSRFLGVLYVSAPASGRSFGPSDLSVMEALAAQAATALEALSAREAQEAHIARLEKALKLIEDQREAANLDPLTGVFGPGYFMERLKDEVQQARRYGHTVSVLVLDPDRIGELNERFGRQTGDGVLGRIASELKAVSRQTDIVARIGGDEFAVLMPRTPREGAQRVAERVRKELEELALLDAEGQEVWALRGAMAAVEWRSPEGPDELLERALGELKAIS